MADPKRNPAPPSDPEPGHYGAGYGEQVPEEAPANAGTTADGGEAVVFTPDDVHARPPDHPPTDAAPESEKAGLIFERS